MVLDKISKGATTTVKEVLKLKAEGQVPGWNGLPTSGFSTTVTVHGVCVIGDTSSSSPTSTVNTCQANSSGHQTRIVTSQQRPVRT